MNKVTLTQEEAQWFSRNVIKMANLLAAQSKNDPGILDRSTYKTLESMREKAIAIDQMGEEYVERVDVQLSRKQKLIVAELIQSVNKTLIDRILPEYERRGGHEKYIKMGQEKAQYGQNYINQ